MFVNMRKLGIILVPVLTLLWPVLSAAQDGHDHVNGNITPYHDAIDLQNGITGIQFNADIKWQAFLKHNTNWGAYFTANNNMPHKASGPGIECSGNSFDEKARNFVVTQLPQYNIPFLELQLTSEHADSRYTNLNYKQVRQGMEVLFSRAQFRFGKDGKLCLFGLDVYDQQTPQLAPVISLADAHTLAQQSLVATAVHIDATQDLKLFPMPVDGKIQLVPVYEFTIDATLDGTATPAKFYTLVSAVDGDILYRENKVVQVGTTIQGPQKKTNKWSPTIYKPLPYIKMVVNGNTYTADSAGLLTIPGVTATGTLSLDGSFCNTRMAQATGVPIAYSATLTGATLDFDTAATGSNFRPSNVYYHTTFVHDFMKKKLGGSFTALDFALPAYVDNTSDECNAFYNGSSINFYDEGASCNATGGIADVVYHEYGHGINDKYYTANGASFSNGAMGEGYADVWAMSIIDNAIIGQGFYLNNPNGGIRAYNAAPKVYPVDIIGEVHADGEIIAGAWWDTYQNWGELDSTSQLFADTYPGLATAANGLEGQLYYDILIDALSYDDDDANISNGTPHFLHIARAFAKHGIFLNMNSTFAHTPQHYTPANAPVTLDGTIIPQFPVFIGDVKVFYRLKPGITVTTYKDSILMSSTGNFNYTCTFPAKAEGDLFEYYFGVFDNYYQNSPAVSAHRNSQFAIVSAQRNLPYFLLFGMQTYIKEDFEGNSIWTAGLPTDDATTSGKWVIANPVGSTTAGKLVQTDKDHTTGSGKCAVTGNATSATSAFTSADVDGGVTTLQSPEYNLSSFANPYVSFYRWFSNSQGTRPRRDEFRVALSDNGGTSWRSIDRTFEPEVSWSRMVYRIKDASFFVDLNKVQFRVYAVDSMSSGSVVEAAFDDFEILDYAAPAGLDNQFAIAVSTYPNPASSTVTTVFSKQGSGTLQIFDAIGQLVCTQGFSSTSEVLTNVAELSSGIYQMRITMDGNSIGTKSIAISH
jgi:hypothetical protein